MNHATVARTLSYIAGAAALAQQFVPTLVPPPYGLIAAAVIGIGLNAGHQIYAAVTKTPTVASVIKAFLPAMLLLPLLLGGCATLQGFFGSPVGQATVVAAVDVAVATAEQKGVSAAEINGIAHQALAADSGTSASLAAIAGVVNAELAKLKLPPGDLAAAEVLEVALEAAIEQKIGQNPTVAQTQTAVAAVLQEVITASGG